MKKLLREKARKGGASPEGTRGPETRTVQEAASNVTASVHDVLFSSWSWKVDGPLAVVVAVAYFYDEQAAPGLLKAVLSVLALVSLGVILKRNLRTDVKWKELADVVRQARIK